MKHLLSIVGIVPILLFTCSFCLAESSSLSPGLSPVQVKALLGEPERRTGVESEVSRWHYGKSMVIFSNGTVAAWSDTGKISEILKEKGKSMPESVKKSNVLEKLSDEELHGLRLQFLMKILNINEPGDEVSGEMITY